MGLVRAAETLEGFLMGRKANRTPIEFVGVSDNQGSIGEGAVRPDGYLRISH